MPAGPLAVVSRAADAQSVYVGLADNSIKQIKITDGKEIKALPAQHKGAVVGLAISPGGSGCLLPMGTISDLEPARRRPEGEVRPHRLDCRHEAIRN